MPHLATRTRPWPRRALALTGTLGLLCLGSLAPATALVEPTVTGAGTTGHVAAKATASDGGTKLTGVAMWDPKTRSPYSVASTVTVSQTTNLVNQFVTVSWTGFTPSNTSETGGIYNTDAAYPVQVAECAGTDPGSVTANCDGLDYSIQEPGSAGPTTQVDALTGAAVSPITAPTQGGAGQVNIQILTDQQNSALGCDATTPCSLVVLPVDGGDDFLPNPNNPPKCTDHNGDVNQLWATTGRVFPSNTACAWADRFVIPLHFAPGQDDCLFSSPDFTVSGSPMMQRAMNSWIGKLCHGSDAEHFLFTGSVNEPTAVTYFLNGTTDVALTTEPANGPATGRSYTYAPVGISASVVAYWMDDPKTGQPYTDLQLTPRLVTKLITESYNFAGWGCTARDVKDPPFYGCDNYVEKNPQSMFSDPDFRQYNPTMHGDVANEGESDWPTVLSGDSDMTYELTRWIAANPAAMLFVDGFPDPWGMHVNIAFQGTQFPEEAFESQDQYKAFQLEYSPQFPLDRVVAYQADNWDPGYNLFNSQCTGPPPTPPICEPQTNSNQLPGSRDLVAIIDEADAAGDDFPTAALQNHEGRFVTATTASMAAAVSDMVTSSNGITEDDNENATNKDAYPLTMVVYAMVPTSNTPKPEAQKIAQWLDYVAGGGQDQGTGIGQLPAGYLPLTAKMRQQTLKAAYEVAHQTGNKPPGGYHSKPGGGGKSGNPGSGSPSASKSPAPGSSSPPGSVAPAKVNDAYSSADADGMIRWVLPLLLAVGALLALAGPSAVVLSRPGARAAVVKGWRHVTKFTSHLGRTP
jgi:hypothetical protein